MGAHDKGSNERVTLQTIADRLGVSRTTISNAYGRPDQLKPELREAIFHTAKELGYAGPNAAARSLRSGRAGAIGLLVTVTLSYTVSDPAAVLMLRGFAKVFDERGLNLLTLPAPADVDTGIAAAKNAMVDGFLAFCVTENDPRLLAIMERKLPIVAIDEPRKPGLGFVGIDDRGSAKAIAQHVLALGHRHIGILSLPFKGANRAGFVDRVRYEQFADGITRDRINGYREAFGEVGIDAESVPIYECFENCREDGEAGAAALLDRADRPSAILATGDLLALGAMRAARQRGIDVPRDLSVTGFDDIPDARHALTPLTTIRQPLQEKGELAARLVVDGWEPDDPPVLILATELVIRASAGPAPSR